MDPTKRALAGIILQSVYRILRPSYKCGPTTVLSIILTVAGGARQSILALFFVLVVSSLRGRRESTNLPL